MNSPRDHNIKVVLFDYGGVLAEEGFREGLKAIGRANGLDPDQFFRIASEAVYDSGYVVGTGDESAYWRLVKERTGIANSEAEARAEILDRFILRSWAINMVRHLRDTGYKTGILSDQTDWLDWLSARDGLFKEFDWVFNSYYIGLSKRDFSIFEYVIKTVAVPAESILFIDDNQSNVVRAAFEGLRTIHYVDKDSFFRDLKSFFGHDLDIHG